MAQRFGGKYSPDAKEDEPGPSASAPKGQFDGARVDPVGFRTNILFLPPILIAFFSLNDGALGLSVGLIAAALLVLAAWLLREGLRAAAAYEARRVAKRPAIPRKIFASVLTGAGIALAAFRTEMADAAAQAGMQAGVLAPALYGLAVALLHSAAFGIDPMRDKGMEGIDTFQQNRVARAVDEAETLLGDMSDAILRAGDRRIEARVERFQTTVRDLFRTVEEDPRDLAGARKYLTVYLQGARDATVKFSDIYARTRDAQALTDYTALLDDLEQNFAARTRKMLLDDRSDLTVEIEVLRDRLQREGVKPD